MSHRIYRVLLALFPSLVAGTCLPNASLVKERKNLFNPLTGESYPIGLWDNGNYPAAKLSSRVAQILIEELLHYNVEPKGTSAFTVDTFFALMGCKKPLDDTDRGCGSVSYVHMALEVWTNGYKAEWDDIQSGYPDAAPKLLGNMGYYGTTAMYIPAAVQQKAYNADGINLDFYREYNASWRAPSIYFTPPGDLDVSRLLPCTENALMSNEVMRIYAELSGDWFGVVQQVHESTGSSILVSKCFDDYFWYSPACRADPTTCVTVLTGGPGWGLGEIVVKAAAFNMPLATAVASEWRHYATLPLDFDLMFYWWTPDPTFLRLQPARITFPAHDPEAWEKADRRTEGKDLSIDKMVSRDLALLAPDVDEFLSRLKVSLRDMNAMLLEQMNTENSDFDVACSWLLSNTEKWTPWLPERGKCFPQFGIYSEQHDAFLDAREPVTITCKACPSGTYSSQLEDDEGITHICKSCAAGSFQPLGAAVSCSPCPAGSYQDETGSVTCNRCTFGTYQNQEGQRSCKRCPDGSTTLFLGSDSIQDCGCKAGYISIGSESIDCIRCGEGIDCPFSSSLSRLQLGQPSSSEQLVTQVQHGYFATTDDPLKLFRCRPTAWCPGGKPGRCAGGLQGVPCALCPDGMTWAGGECADCGATAAAWVVVELLVLLACAASYFLVNRPVSAQAAPFKAAQMAGGLVISTLQIFALLGLTSAKWPRTFEEVSSSLQVFVLELDNLHFKCLLGSSPVASYEFTALACPLLVVWMLVCYVSTQTTFAQRAGITRWSLPYTCNTIGFGLNMAFGTIAAVSLKPMMCFRHPNGRYSVLSYPNVFCEEEGHELMLAFGILLLAVVVVGFPAACSYSTWKLPYWSITGNHGMVQCFRFCTSNFQLNCYSFVLLILFRGLGFAVAIAVGTNSPPVQKALVSLILMIYTTLVAKMQPWKVPAMNLADWVVSGSLLMLASSSLQTNSQMEAEFAEGLTVVIIVLVITCLSVMMLLSVLAMVLRLFGGNWTPILNLECISPDHMQISQALQECAAALVAIQSADLCGKIQHMNYYDVKTILNIISVCEVDLDGKPRAPFIRSSSPGRVTLKALNTRLSSVVPSSDSFSEVGCADAESTVDDFQRHRRYGPPATQEIGSGVQSVNWGPAPLDFQEDARVEQNESNQTTTPGRAEVIGNPSVSVDDEPGRLSHRETFPIAEEYVDVNEEETNQTLN